MQIPVLVERVAGNGYRARGAEPLGFVAEGPTRETALAKLKELVQARLRQGAEIVSIRELLGHASIASSERYAKVSNQKVKQVYLKTIRKVMQQSKV